VRFMVKWMVGYESLFGLEVELDFPLAMMDGRFCSSFTLHPRV
jgi:hypothetical protein